MDRNINRTAKAVMYDVALRKESVDRNMSFSLFRPAAGSSLSARRAWIEMTYVTRLPRVQVSSLSARRAWIEIRRVLGFVDPDKVALRKESVDRNPHVNTSSVRVSCRSPQGERG